MANGVADRLAHDAVQVQGVAGVQQRIRQVAGLVPAQADAHRRQPLRGFAADVGEHVAQCARRAARTRHHVAQVLQDGACQVGLHRRFGAIDQRQQLGAEVVVQVGIDALALLGCRLFARFRLDHPQPRLAGGQHLRGGAAPCQQHA